MGLALATETPADVTCVISGHELSVLALGYHVLCFELLTYKDPKPLCGQPFPAAFDTRSGHHPRRQYSSVALGHSECDCAHLH